jgi:hypothetical protein
MAFFDLPQLVPATLLYLLVHYSLLVYANIVSVHSGFITQWSVSPRGFLAERACTQQDRRPRGTCYLLRYSGFLQLGGNHLAQYAFPAREATLVARET